MPRPLTAAQQALAADPEALRLARHMARCRARNFPHLADDLESAALLGLVEAASRYTPDRGVPFRGFAARRILGALLDCCRRQGLCGYRRGRPGKPTLCSLDAAQATDTGGQTVTLADQLAADEHPVGWEAESADTVEFLAHTLGGQEREYTLEYFLFAGRTHRRMATDRGLSETRISQVFTSALANLRQVLAPPTPPEEPPYPC